MPPIPRTVTVPTMLEHLPEIYLPRHKRQCVDRFSVISIGAVHCANGIIHYKAFCTVCMAKGGAIPKHRMAGVDTASLPVLRSHTINPCERCGSTEGSELHHWAPRHLFSNADDWPKSFLCKSCHAEWHRVVTPLMHVNDNTRGLTNAA